MVVNSTEKIGFDPDRLKLMDEAIKVNSSKFNSDNLFFSGKLKK